MPLQKCHEGFVAVLHDCIGVLFVLFCFVLFFQDRVFMYSPGCPGIHSVDQAGLKLRNSPASVSQVLGLKVCATMPSPRFYSLCQLSSPCFAQLLNFISPRSPFLLLENDLRDQDVDLGYSLLRDIRISLQKTLENICNRTQVLMRMCS